MKVSFETGGPGSGKTSRLLALLAQLEASGQAFRAVLQVATGPRSPGKGAMTYDLWLLECLPPAPSKKTVLPALARRRPEGGYDFQEGLFAQARQFLLRQPLPGRLFLDELGLTELSGGGHRALLDALRAQAPEELLLTVTCRDDLAPGIRALLEGP